jgi:hypothetical protein
MDAWYDQQAGERDHTKRQDLLDKMQQKRYDAARCMPIWAHDFLWASGLRAAVSGLTLIPLFAYAGPDEDVQRKS